MRRIPGKFGKSISPERKARRITSNNDDCIRPFYLPDDRIVYARRSDGKLAIETSDLGGGKVLPLTYISANSLPTDVLRDGRILFEAGYPLGTDRSPELYTVYSDGSGVESYRCDHGPADTLVGRAILGTSYSRSLAAWRDSLRPALNKSAFRRYRASMRETLLNLHLANGSYPGVPMPELHSV